MGLKALVRGDVVRSEDEDQYEEAGIRLSVEFDEERLLPLLKKVLPKVSKDEKFSRLSVLTEDHLLELLEHGGEVDVSHIHDLADDIHLLEKHLDALKLKRSEANAFENFLDELHTLAEASRDVDAPVEFFKTEEDEDSDAEGEDTDKEADGEGAEEGDEDLGDDEDDEDEDEEDDEDEDEDGDEDEDEDFEYSEDEA